MPFRLRHPPKPKDSERQVVRQCLAFLRCRGYWPIRQHVGTFQAPHGEWVQMGEVGLPDYAMIHGFYPGFFLETKATGKKLSPAQQRKIAEIRQSYRLAVAAVDSVHDLISWLNEHEREATAKWLEQIRSMEKQT